MAQAQRGPRSDVGTLTTSEAAALANEINGWLDLHPDLSTTHGVEFNAIHSLPNFFPWHRAHIRELEEAMSTVPSEPFLLPRWRPRAGTGEPSNAMPEPLRLTNGTPQLPGMPDSDPLVAIPASITLPGACTTSVGVDEFSTLVQGAYHDLVHSAVGGRFLDPAESATVIGFWPWHAWVDEFWYNWENNCTTGYDYAPSSGTEIIINSEVTWSGERFVKGKVIIENGGRLNIAPDAVIRFRSSDYEAYETSILVKPGGLLYVNGATLTGIDRFGADFGGAGGIQYHSGWKGIVVEGTGAPGSGQGQVSVINSSVIEHASVGIESVKGGRVVATNSDFLNNRISIYIHDYGHAGYGHFYIANCDFDVTDALRDVTWQPDGGLLPRHFLHNIPQIPNRFVRLENINYAQIIGATFKRTFSNADVVNANDRLTTGIEAIDARFSCTGGTEFEATLDFGILATGSVSGLMSGPTIRNCIFRSRDGIVLNGVNYTTIASNAFTTARHGILSEAASSYDIVGNSFNSTGAESVGILSQDLNGSYANIIEDNDFTGGQAQIQFQFSNPNVQFRCNDFYTPGSYAVALESGDLPNQGSCLLKPAGNWWDNLTGCLGEGQLYRELDAGNYVYSSHSDRTPTCVSTGIGVVPCTYNYLTRPSCETSPPCNPCEDFPEEGEITSREAQKQFWSESTLSSEEIADIVWQLTWEQKIIAQRGLVRVVEADSSLATAFEYLDEVGTVFPFPASDRIGLYLRIGNFSTANSLIAALPVGNEKTLFTLVSTMRAQGRSFKQITPTEEQTVRAMAQGSDQASVRANAVLFAAFGENIVIEPEPLGSGERPATETVAAQSPLTATPTLTFMPNPSSDAITVHYTIGTVSQYGNFFLTDLFGRQVLAQRFAPASTGQFNVNLSDLPSGTYVGTIIVDGHCQLVSRLVIVR